MEVTWPLWESGDEHRVEGVTTSTVRPHCWAGRTLPLLAAASSGVGECQGGVSDVETMMVAGFGMVGQAGEESTLEQSARHHPESVDTHAWHRGHAWSPRDLSPPALCMVIADESKGSWSC